MSKSWHKKRMKRMTCDDLADLERIWICASQWRKMAKPDSDRKGPCWECGPWPFTPTSHNFQWLPVTSKRQGTCCPESGFGKATSRFSALFFHLATLSVWVGGFQGLKPLRASISLQACCTSFWTMKALILTQTRKGPGHPAAEQESQRPTANSTPRFIPFPNIKHPPRLVPNSSGRPPAWPSLPPAPAVRPAPSARPWLGTAWTPVVPWILLGKPNKPSSTLLY